MTEDCEKIKIGDPHKPRWNDRPECRCGSNRYGSYMNTVYARVRAKYEKIGYWCDSCRTFRPLANAQEYMIGKHMIEYSGHLFCTGRDGTLHRYQHGGAHKMFAVYARLKVKTTRYGREPTPTPDYRRIGMWCNECRIFYPFRCTCEACVAKRHSQDPNCDIPLAEDVTMLINAVTDKPDQGVNDDE